MSKQWTSELYYVNLEFCQPHEWKWALESLAPGEYLAWYADLDEGISATVYLVKNNCKYLLLREDRTNVVAEFSNFKVFSDFFKPPHRFIYMTLDKERKQKNEKETRNEN